MKLEITFDDFVNKYYAQALGLADITIANYISKYGNISSYIDVELVKQIATSYGLEKVYKSYDGDRENAASLKTYMSKVIHNCVISELQKAWTDVKRNHPELVKPKKRTCADIKYKSHDTRFRSIGDDGYKKDPHNYMEVSGVYERKEKVIARMNECIKKLLPEDQIILKFWADSEGNYVERVLEYRKIENNKQTQQMVRTRCHRALKELKKLMGGMKPNYRDIYVPSGEFRKAAVEAEPVDKNLERRRARAIRLNLSEHIDYQKTTSKLYDKIIK